MFRKQGKKFRELLSKFVWNWTRNFHISFYINLISIPYMTIFLQKKNQILLLRLLIRYGIQLWTLLSFIYDFIFTTITNCFLIIILFIWISYFIFVSYWMVLKIILNKMGISYEHVLLIFYSPKLSIHIYNLWSRILFISYWKVENVINLNF